MHVINEHQCNTINAGCRQGVWTWSIIHDPNECLMSILNVSLPPLHPLGHLPHLPLVATSTSSSSSASPSSPRCRLILLFITLSISTTSPFASLCSSHPLCVFNPLITSSIHLAYYSFFHPYVADDSLVSAYLLYLSMPRILSSSARNVECVTN